MIHTVVTKGAHALTALSDDTHSWSAQVAFLYARHYDGEIVVGMYLALDELKGMRDDIDSEIRRIEGTLADA